MTPLERAIDALGSQAALAEAMTKAGKPTTQQAISWWLNNADGVVSPEYAPTMEAVSGVSRHDLNPKIFGPAPKLSTRKAA